jgi:predicted 3-demethylubiquinone-9 3-methyltransferase (glyoxalase superfamily)
MQNMENNTMAICLWFDNQAEEAVNFYTSIFKNSSVNQVNRYGKEHVKMYGKQEGDVMNIDFMLNGIKFIALNGGPDFTFNEAISVMIYCDTQEEVDHYWKALTQDGEESNCGWLKDKYGISWQIVPNILQKYLTDGDIEKRNRVHNSFLKMRKFDIAKLEEAYMGK